MKQLSAFGRRHKTMARIIITVAWVMLTGLGIFAGASLSQLGTTVPFWVFSVAAAIFLGTALIYPFRLQQKRSNPRSFYIWRKTCDMLVAATSFIMIVYSANNPGILFGHTDQLNAAVVSLPTLPGDSATRSYKTIREFSASLKHDNGSEMKWKEKKKLLKAQVKAIKKSPDISKGERTLLVILSVLAAMGLLFLVGSLACTLSCNGSGAAAILVAVGGTVLTLWLLIIVIRSLYGNKRKKKVQQLSPVVPAPN